MTYKFTSAALEEMRQAVLRYEENETGLGKAFWRSLRQLSFEFWQIRWHGVPFPNVLDVVAPTVSRSDLSIKYVRTKYLFFQSWISGEIQSVGNTCFSGEQHYPVVAGSKPLISRTTFATSS